MTIITTSTSTSLSNHAAYAHTFSENENALYITIMHQIQAQIQLVENNFPTNIKLAQQHVSLAIETLNQNDPIVNNTTWAREIAEKNPRVAAELTSTLNGLKTTAAQSKPTSTTTTTANNAADDIKTKVTRIDDLLGEAISSRVSKQILNNSTTQALVLANLGNEIYFSYGRALGESPASMSNMAGMSMSDSKGNSMNMNTSMITTKGGAGTSSSMDMASRTIKNVTDYQTAQSLAAKAQEIFNTNLKPIAPSKAIAANTGLEKNLSQLKSAIDNKAPFMDIMKLVHVQIHPTLIAAYNLQLKAF